MKKMTAGLILGALVCLMAPAAMAAQEIQWWHAMGGKLGERVSALCDKFNASQDKYKIVPVYKGTYPEVMTAAIASFRAGQHPAIVQVFEVGTASMMAAKGAVYPVHQLMADMGKTFDASAFLPAVAAYYTTPGGKMLSMPFNSSTPVMYYNKTAFKAAGLDPQNPPKTWPEFEAAARKLVESKAVKYGFSTAWQQWVQLENLSAWHDVPLGTKGNGFEGADTTFTFNGPLPVRHLEWMSKLNKEGIFKYAGRKDDANPVFINGDCGLYFNSSGNAMPFTTAAKFEVGVAPLPYWPDVKDAPQNSIIGGATLWVLAKRDKAEYPGVAEFFQFLSSPEIQAEWHQATGYVPVTVAAYELTKKQGFYEKNPGMEVGIKQLTNKAPTPNSKGLRFGNYVQVREIMDEEMEALWSGQKDAKAALDSAVARGNEQLRKFEAANK